jgi:hypothetical protein
MAGYDWYSNGPGEDPTWEYLDDNGIPTTPPVFVADPNAPNTADPNAGADATVNRTLPAWYETLGQDAKNLLKATFSKPDGSIDWNKALGAGGAAAGSLYGMLNNKPATPTGYQGGIPSLVATRQQAAPPASQPTPHAYGAPAMGQRYFTDTQYTKAGDAPALAAAQTAATNQAAALNNPAVAAAQAAAAQTAANTVGTGTNNTTNTVQAAHGGLMGLAAGGQAGHPRYLQGSTDGMADKLPASIDGQRPAKLSHGEFVVPADVVSHLGNGNSDAGAQHLYSMMDRVRKARTGTKKQGKEINPAKFTGGLAASKYAEGGVIGFDGTTGSTVPAGTTGTESNLSNWAGPYVTNMLGQGAALANQPYQAYQGQLTAGSSPLQDQAFNSASSLTTPSSIGTAATNANNASSALNTAAATGYDTAGTNVNTGIFGSAQAQQYMNPYLQQSLNPQIAEARRQSQITQTGNDAKATQAGAFGGSRQALMNTETQRNLGDNLANITGKGYDTAYQNAQQQFNADQQRQLQASQSNMQNAQFGAQYGLNASTAGATAAQTAAGIGQMQNNIDLGNMNAQAAQGATQRGIESDSLNAQQAAFNAERDNPYKMVQYQQSLLQGLPLAAQSYSVTQPSGVQAGISGAGSAIDLLTKLGLYTPQTAAATTGTTTGTGTTP